MLKHLIFISILFVTYNAQGAAGLQLYDVRSLSLKNGLVQSSVRGVLQDNRGLIWLGTEAGVQRFDGLNLKSLAQLVKAGPNHQLDTIWIYQILELPSGDILFATRRNGLLKYTPKRRSIMQFTQQGYADSLIDKSAYFEICYDKQGQLFAATNEGLLQLNVAEGNWQVLIAAKSRERFNEVACKGEHLITTFNSKLLRYHKTQGQYQSFTINSLVESPDALHIEQRPDGKILVGKPDGLFLVNDSFTGLIPLWPQDRQESTLSKAGVNHILPQGDNQIWLATSYHGLLLFDLKLGQVKKHIFNNSDSDYTLSGNHILRLMKDQSGLLWASVYGSGIDRLHIDQQAMRTFYNPSKNALNDNDITAIAAGPGDHLWFASNRTGIKRLSVKDMTTTNFNQQIIKAYQHYNPGELPYISDIAVDSLNRLWFTTNAGLMRVSLSTFNHHFYPIKADNQAGPRVRGRDIYIDQSSALYVTDQGGILRYHPDTDSFTRLPIADKTSPDTTERLWGIRQKEDGPLYVLGTNNLYQVDQDDKLQPVLKPEQLDNAFGGRMSAFAVNDAGDIYIAAQGALIEVNIVKGQSPKVQIYSGEKLPDNYFYSIELDNQGNPWLSTNNGLVHFNAISHTYGHYSLPDGVLVREFNGRASFRRPNGHIIFGGIDGWTVVAPEQLLPDNTTPRLLLSSYKTGTDTLQTQLTNGKISMDYEDHWLQFSFAALDFHSPRENQYAFFLEGFDPDWRNYGNQSQISFTGLPPGNYTLHARASTKRGNWHPQPMQIKVEIAPPKYRSNLAYAGYSLILIILVGTFAWRRNRLLRERRHYVDLIETSRERMRLALWGSGDSIWDWQVQDNQIFRTSIEFLGYHDESIATIESFKSMIHPDDLVQFETELAEVLACNTTEYTAQFRMKDKQGNWHWVSDRGKVIEVTPDNQPVRLSGSLRDVSELKRHEQELEGLNNELEKKIAQRTQQYIDKNEQLSDTLGTLKNTQQQLVESEKMASLGNLVAGISHEINTPVGVALTAASHNSLTIGQLQELFVKRTLTVKDMNKGLEQLKNSNDLVESSINRTAQLIQTFKQVAVDHDHHAWRIIEMPAYLSEIAPTFNLHQNEKNVQLNVLDGKVFNIECAPGDLYQIISQLISNSIDHGFNTSSGGKITIETQKCADHWLLIYKDNGSGILNDTLEHIFEPFYTTKRGSGYAGLGMHLVYNIISHSLGGTIDCQSKPGEGITFVITLPLNKPNNP